MYITLNKKTSNNTATDYNFDTLLNNSTIPTKQITKKKQTLEIDPPNKIPQQIILWQSALKYFATSHPEAMCLTATDISARYKKHRIKKKNGGYRTINEPDLALKTLQRKILELRQTFGNIEHDSAFAYIKGRSIYDAVQRHQNNNSQWFLKVDLKSFFDSCTEDFIYQQLIKIYPYSLLISDENCDTIIKQIINIACLNGVLPQGNPLAPYLTNLIMLPLDYRLNTLAPVYTRYSDDMLFSARTKFDLNKTIKNIEHILKDTPLKINHEKTRLGSRNGNNWNLGLMLNKDNCITIGHEKKRIYKATIDQFLTKPETYTVQQIQQLAGLTAYYLYIEPAYFNFIINKYNKKHNKNLLKLLHNPEFCFG